MTILNQTLFAEYNKQLLPKGKKYLIAVSGGADSMCLLHLMHNVGFDVQVAHINYQLRAEHSEADAELVNAFCNTRNIICHSQKVDTKNYMLSHKMGLQEAARAIRYNYFASICKQQNIDYILTAHHANDNIETVLMHIGRGSGLKGITGIAAKNNNILRPLLPFSKIAIYQYLQENKIAFREDASNAKNDYTRNAVRNILIPEWQKIQSAFENNMLQNIALWQDSYAIYQDAIEKQKSKLLLPKGTDYWIPIRLLTKQKSLHVWMYELFNPFGFSVASIPEITKLLASASGKFIENEQFIIHKDRNFLILSPKKTSDNSIHFIHSPEEVQTFRQGTLSMLVKEKPKSLLCPKEICMLDKKSIIFPLILRPYAAGDYFYPLGMPKKKKVARFLINEKIPQPAKEKIWVLESNKKIVWIIGYRIDDRFKVKNNTEDILEITFKPNEKNG